MPGFVFDGTGPGYYGVTYHHHRNPAYNYPDEGYSWPRGGVKEIERSFLLHASKRDVAISKLVNPTREEFDITVSRVLGANQVRFRQPILPGDERFDWYFSQALRSLDPKSSTGLGPYSKAATIGDALGWDGFRFRKTEAVGKLKSHVISRLRAFSSTVPAEFGTKRGTELGIGQSLEKLAFDTKEEVEEGGEYYRRFCDPIKFFIKDEPHKAEKVAEGRLRLIHCFGLVDQMVDRILFLPWQGVEVRNPMATTQKAGWSPFPGGYQRLEREFPLDLSFAVDKTAWDWTVPGWIIGAYVSMKLAQIHGEVSEEYLRCVWGRLYCVVGPGARFRMPSGVEWRQLHWGLMKTGWLLTLSLNSAAQAFQHALTCLRMNMDFMPHIWAMGDDTIVRLKDMDLNQYEQLMSTTGCIVKKIVKSREFSGFYFHGNDHVEPLYGAKHRFILNYLSPDLEQETLLSYCLLYALHTPDWTNVFRSRLNRALGPAAELWAKGLAPLNISFELPPWTKID